MIFLLLSSALAAETTDPEGPTTIAISGLYSAWWMHQKDFTFGSENIYDDTDLLVQMLRVNAKLEKKAYGVVTRFDAAQGWWGVDNDPATSTTYVYDPATGTLSSSTSYNADGLFQDKDTNYGVHVDLAYGWVQFPSVPVRLSVGRQYYGVGHKLVLDEDYEGAILTVSPGTVFSGELSWAKVSEGYGSYRSPTGALMTDNAEISELNPALLGTEDADLFGAKATLKLKPGPVEVFGLYYNDNSGTDANGDQLATFLPNGLGYGLARFQPNISMAMAFGVSADGKLDVAEGLVYAAEFDYLSGQDNVKNADHVAGLLDINNGTLSGWNAYASLTQSLAVGVPLDVGVSFGMGSGDEDPTGGVGNINHIQTMGFFPFTNVWEDSIMTDIEGISPQGLGSPALRGYREFENTTAVQGTVGVKPVAPLRLDLSYTWLKSTVPVHGFDLTTGEPSSQTASDLGSEVDANLAINIYKGVSYAANFGYFMPGEAAGLLINGTGQYTDPAWEVKQAFTVKF